MSYNIEFFKAHQPFLTDNEIRNKQITIRDPEKARRAIRVLFSDHNVSVVNAVFDPVCGTPCWKRNSVFCNS